MSSLFVKSAKNFSLLGRAISHFSDSGIIFFSFCLGMKKRKREMLPDHCVFNFASYTLLVQQRKTMREKAFCGQSIVFFFLWQSTLSFYKDLTPQTLCFFNSLRPVLNLA